MEIKKVRLKWLIASGVFFLPKCSIAFQNFFRKKAPYSFSVASSAPQAFSKTHFIVGTDGSVQAIQDIEKPQAPVTFGGGPFAIKNNEPVKALLFSPDDNVRAALEYLIQHERSSIMVAVFIFTDSEIAHSLFEARKRGVQIEIITDPTCLRDRHNKITSLCDNGCFIYVYDPSGSKNLSSSCMHHKFALFKKNAYDKSILWTGSYNFTRSASQSNQENAMIFDDSYLVGRFTEQFGKLKRRSYRYSPVAGASDGIKNTAKKVESTQQVKNFRLGK